MFCNSNFWVLSLLEWLTCRSSMGDGLPTRAFLTPVPQNCPRTRKLPRWCLSLRWQCFIFKTDLILGTCSTLFFYSSTWLRFYSKFAMYNCNKKYDFLGIFRCTYIACYFDAGGVLKKKNCFDSSRSHEKAHCGLMANLLLWIIFERERWCWSEVC